MFTAVGEDSRAAAVLSEQRPFEREILEILLNGFMEIGDAKGHLGAKESSSLLQLYSSEYKGW